MAPERGALSETWRTCGICEGRPKGTNQHYHDVHKLCILTFKLSDDECYEMAVPWKFDLETNTEGYWCPVCEARRNAIGALQQHLASNSCKKGYDKQAWIDQELTSRNDCEIVFKNGVEAILEREGGYFWCPGCGLGSPFPGSMKLHARGCECTLPGQTVPRQFTLEDVKQRMHHSETPGRRTYNPQMPTPTPEEEEDEDEDMEVEMAMQEFVQGRSSDHSASPEKNPTVEPANAPAGLPAHSPRAGKKRAREYSPSQEPPSQVVAQLPFLPCLPDSDVHRFVQDIEAPRASAYSIFHAFSNGGIATAEDLNTLASLIYENAQAENILKQRGMNHIEWLVVRHTLLNRSSAHSCPGPDPEFRTFLTSCTPSLTAIAPLLHSLCLHTSQDLLKLSATPAEWPHLQKYLLAKDVSLIQWLALRRGLQSLLPDVGDRAANLTNRAPRVNAPLGAKEREALRRVGLHSEADINTFCATGLDHLDELLEMLSKEGLTYSECKVVEAEFIERGEALSYG